MVRFRTDSPSPAPDFRRRGGFARRCERCCGATMRSFPLVLVYGLTTWAIYTQARTCLVIRETSWRGDALLAASVLIYGMLTWSYTVAVFTDPGSPTSTRPASRHQYSQVPSAEQEAEEDEDDPQSSITVKSTGGMRYCKKCQTKKPDRAHHCSTCGQCVLKMDHHCPWLATCVGLRNYKAFLLFCGYVTLFCWLCFGTAAAFLWGEIASQDMSQQADLFNINIVVLAVIAAIFGLVLTGFTAWHVSLAVRNQTTIECLEKTRYLNPIRRTMDRATQAFARGSDGPRDEETGLMQRYGHQLAEIHANAIPGVTRAEEGEERASPPTTHVASPPAAGEERITAAEALRMSYHELERAREVERYEDYLDERDSAKLPHAFDLGWRRNLRDLFGADWRLWLLPVCNSAGDGWRWETSARWTAAQRDLQQARDLRAREQEAREVAAGWGHVGVHPPAAGAWRYEHTPIQRRREEEDTASTDGIFANDEDDEDSAARPSRDGDGWRDWD